MDKFYLWGYYGGQDEQIIEHYKHSELQTYVVITGNRGVGINHAFVFYGRRKYFCFENGHRVELPSAIRAIEKLLRRKIFTEGKATPRELLKRAVLGSK